MKMLLEIQEKVRGSSRHSPAAGQDMPWNRELKGMELEGISASRDFE